MRVCIRSRLRQLDDATTSTSSRTRSGIQKNCRYDLDSRLRGNDEGNQKIGTRSTCSSVHLRGSDNVPRVRMRVLATFFPLGAMLILPFLLALTAGRPPDPAFEVVNLAGEVTDASVILQARVERADSMIGEVPGWGDVPGFEGWGRFEIARDSAFGEAEVTTWRRLTSENDFILRAHVTGLEPQTRYVYRVRAGRDTLQAATGRVASFVTLPAPDIAADVHFAMISCMNYEKFFGLGSMQTQTNPAAWARPATGEDVRLGFPAFDVLLERGPDFWIGNGDNVYYDSPTEQPERHARTREELRAKWHRQFAMPRLRRLADRAAAYWLKDDHDYRFNDADTTASDGRQPSHRLGVELFREQVPVVPPGYADTVTYRTVRAGRLVQLWFLEGRDYRSPNAMPDGPAKTLWGDEQEAWLKRTLLESDAPFKILVSPTPLVGPDDAYKRDNHTNPGGFRHEGRAFIDWLVAHDLAGETFVLNGDRHWQYHSIHPSGLEEFSAGAFVSQNAREGREPGDPESTDPEGLIDQPYIQTIPVGGFLDVRVRPEGIGGVPSILFAHYDERGELLYAARRYANGSIAE